MTEYVCDLFGGVANNQVEQPRWPDHPYGEEQIRSRIYAVPVKDLRRLTILWPGPDTHQYWESMVINETSL